MNIWEALWIFIVNLIDSAGAVYAVHAVSALRNQVMIHHIICCSHVFIWELSILHLAIKIHTGWLICYIFNSVDVSNDKLNESFEAFLEVDIRVRSRGTYCMFYTLCTVRRPCYISLQTKNSMPWMEWKSDDRLPPSSHMLFVDSRVNSRELSIMADSCYSNGRCRLTCSSRWMLRCESQFKNSSPYVTSFSRCQLAILVWSAYSDWPNGISNFAFSCNLAPLNDNFFVLFLRIIRWARDEASARFLLGRCTRL